MFFLYIVANNKSSLNLNLPFSNISPSYVYLITSKNLLDRRNLVSIDSTNIYIANHAKNFLYYITKKTFKRNLTRNDFDFLKFNFMMNPKRTINAIKPYFSEESIKLIESFRVKLNNEF